MDVKYIESVLSAAVDGNVDGDDLKNALSIVRGVSWGCHCDLEPDMKPDGCVMDDGLHDNCVYATNGGDKFKCVYWQPIKED